MLSPGIAGAAPSIPSVDLSLSFSNGLFEKKIFEVLSHLPKNERRSRGAVDIAIFKNIAPSVVLISIRDGIGTGSVISNGLILTNAHVVGNAAVVGVLYKPNNGSNPAA